MRARWPARRSKVLRAKTGQLLYHLLWCCDQLTRPTWRNLTDSFESWAYRNGLHRELADLETLCLIERGGLRRGDRLYRLTDTGRLRALGGRDPTTEWSRPWDGKWRLVLFDVPREQDAVRNRLRLSLRARGFGYLQNSVWITPHPITQERRLLAGGLVDVQALILMEARPCSGETDAQIVEGAWNLDAVDRNYAAHLNILRHRPSEPVKSEQAAERLRDWGRTEQAAWLQAVAPDPLLPRCLWPPSYIGENVWQERCRVLAAAAAAIRVFASPGQP